MDVLEFLQQHTLLPSQIPAEACLSHLMWEMELGLRGEGNIPMLPSYLSASVGSVQNRSCCVLDAGGTNLRAAKASFDGSGNCRIESIVRVPMPGTLAPMGKQEFYDSLARLAEGTGCPERIGLCFSFNVQMEPDLDGTLLGWCKEIQVPEAVGQPVGGSLKQALNGCCSSVHVLNDSVAAMLGAATPEQPVQVGIILGTGINVCYEEQCASIPKLPGQPSGGSMIISTEVGEFDGFPKSDFDTALFACTEEPELAHGEKQCAGGYLGDLICRVWSGAAEEGLLPDRFRDCRYALPQISDLLAGKETVIPQSEEASLIARTIIHRSAKIAAILCAGPVLRCTPAGEQAAIAIEGSQFQKLRGFREAFHQELTQLLQPRSIRFSFLQTENACLKGAARAAFAQRL